MSTAISPGLAGFLLLLLIAAAAIPKWPYSRHWGYLPAAGLGAAALVLIALLALGKI